MEVPLIELDARGLEPPQPMMKRARLPDPIRVLMRLAELAFPKVDLVATAFEAQDFLAQRCAAPTASTRALGHLGTPHEQFPQFLLGDFEHDFFFKPVNREHTSLSGEVFGYDIVILLWFTSGRRFGGYRPSRWSRASWPTGSARWCLGNKQGKADGPPETQGYAVAIHVAVHLGAR